VSPEAQGKAHAAGGVHLCDDDDGAVAHHREVAGLAGLVRHFVHERTGVSNHAIQRMMAMSQLEEFEGQLEAVGGVGFADVAAPLEAKHHAKDFADAATQAASDFGAGEAGWFRSEYFDDIQTLFQGGSSVAAGCREGAGTDSWKSSGHGDGNSIPHNFPNENHISFMQYTV
jgi:hypothetical protein